MLTGASQCGPASSSHRHTGWATLDEQAQQRFASLPSLASLGFQRVLWRACGYPESGPPSSPSSHASSCLFTASHQLTVLRTTWHLFTSAPDAPLFPLTPSLSPVRVICRSWLLFVPCFFNFSWLPNIAFNFPKSGRESWCCVSQAMNTQNQELRVW